MVRILANGEIVQDDDPRARNTSSMSRHQNATHQVPVLGLFMKLYQAYNITAMLLAFMLSDPNAIADRSVNR